MQTVDVKLAGHPYAIQIGHDWLDGMAARIAGVARTGHVLLITNPKVGALYAGQFAAALARAGCAHVHRHDVPDGEEHKNLDEFRCVLTAAATAFGESQARPVFVNLGGGVINDLGGFAAACFRRGVPMVQVPTTLLACVDSSVGGKTGVDFLTYKNLVGTFYQPAAVLIDLAFLRTLDARELRCGVAEVIKYGVVCDADLFRQLETGLDRLLALDPATTSAIVTRCCELKADVVVEDEFDTLGRRAVLNFGHTAGHAIEAVTGFRVKHGEAVAIGMLVAVRIAAALNACDRALPARVEALVQRAGLPTRVPAGLADRAAVLDAMRRDKKFVSGRNRFVLPLAPGRWELREGIEPAIVEDALASVL